MRSDIKMIETWAKLQGIGIRCSYSVSNMGRIRNDSKSTFNSIGKQNSGYQMVWLRDQASNKDKGMLVHRLVATYFVPNPENKEQVNHIDGNKDNNRADNLEWVTYYENHEHAARTGLKQSRKQLKEQDVIWIRNNFIAYDAEYGSIALGNKYGVSSKTIDNIVHGYKWKHVPMPDHLVPHAPESRHIKISDDDVQWIRDNYKKYDPEYGGTPIAKKYGISIAQVSRIVNNTRR